MKKKYLDYETLKRTVSVFDVLTKHYHLADSLVTIADGKAYSGACPICGIREGNPFRITIEDGTSTWFCLADCSSGGNVLDFVAKKEDTDIHEAVFLLHEWFNLGPDTPASGKTKPGKNRKGYLRELDKELKKLLVEGDDDVIIRFVKEKVLESYRNGQAVKK